MLPISTIKILIRMLRMCFMGSHPSDPGLALGTAGAA